MACEHSIGIDICEVVRWQRVLEESNNAGLARIFSKIELEYCMGRANAAQHLAGTFAAKEAASKALGVHEYPTTTLEIRRDEHGKPHVYRDSLQLSVSISISHTEHTAVAVAIT